MLLFCLKSLLTPTFSIEPKKWRRTNARSKSFKREKAAAGEVVQGTRSAMRSDSEGVRGGGVSYPPKTRPIFDF
ncbi:hypothetical protein GGQ95_003602 [Anoxybacillus rupiensis]|nr:hypothetical protein [Anoxybacillus rupiensis]